MRAGSLNNNADVSILYMFLLAMAGQGERLVHPIPHHPAVLAGLVLDAQTKQGDHEARYEHHPLVRAIHDDDGEADHQYPEDQVRQIPEVAASAVSIGKDYKTFKLPVPSLSNKVTHASQKMRCPFRMHSREERIDDGVDQRDRQHHGQNEPKRTDQGVTELGPGRAAIPGQPLLQDPE